MDVTSRLDPAALPIGQLVVVDGEQYCVARKERTTTSADGAASGQLAEEHNTYLVKVQRTHQQAIHDAAEKQPQQNGGGPTTQVRAQRS